MRGLEKTRMGKGQTGKHADGHRNSMKESAKGRFFEKLITLMEVRKISDKQTQLDNLFVGLMALPYCPALH